MAELKDLAGSVAIVVSSCDAFFDVWRPFAFFFRKHWRDCPFPVFLIVNELRIRSATIQALPVGPDRGWASNMKTALEQLGASHVLYLQEDYFLDRPVRREQLADDLTYAFEHNADALCLRARTDLERGFQPINDRFGVVPRESDGRTRCQLTLWKRQSFLAALREGETAWQMESRGSERTRDMLALSYSTRENASLSYLMSAIVRGLWTPEALTMCRQHNVAITPRFRGTYSPQALARAVRKRLTQHRLERELARARSSVIDLDAAT